MQLASNKRYIVWFYLEPGMAGAAFNKPELTTFWITACYRARLLRS